MNTSWEGNDRLNKVRFHSREIRPSSKGQNHSLPPPHTIELLTMSSSCPKTTFGRYTSMNTSWEGNDRLNKMPFHCSKIAQSSKGQNHSLPPPHTLELLTTFTSCPKASFERYTSMNTSWEGNDRLNKVCF